MNERFIWNMHDAETCNFLADVYTFIADKNKELGHSVRAENRHDIADHWRLNAETCRQKAGKYLASEE